MRWVKSYNTMGFSGEKKRPVRRYATRCHKQGIVPMPTPMDCTAEDGKGGGGVYFLPLFSLNLRVL